MEYDSQMLDLVLDNRLELLWRSYVLQVRVPPQYTLGSPQINH